MRRRLTAVFALVVAAATLVLAIVVAINQFPRGLVLSGCVLLAGVSAWYGLRRRGIARVVGVIVAAVALAAAVLLIVTRGAPLVDLLVVAGVLVSLAAASAAFTVHVDLPSAPPPRQPVLFYNPRSGGGKAERFQLAKEARARGIEPIELKPGDDLEVLVRGAVERGADGLAMAGGDGSQAIVAKVAAEAGLPYACVPAGTRNHFALDLGVDRDDLVGSLDAFADGVERRIDAAEVNGRLFLNNVSLGIYGDAVRQPTYRDAKARTLLETAAEVLGPSAATLDLQLVDDRGRAHRNPAVVLVSNNPYSLDPAGAAGSRPTLDSGELGIIVLDRLHAGQGPGRTWTATRLDVSAPAPVHAGIDGEAVELAPPLHFVIRSRALRVRIARRHPGLSPSGRLASRAGP
jgi:diacylglycerol kinase family enzyme